jgi:hypothetical protein
MYHYHRSTQSPMRRLGVVTFAGAVVCAGSLVTLLGLGGQVDALDATPAKFEPVGPDDLSDLTEPTLPEVPTLDVPIATLPEGPDGPIFDGPIVTIPGESDGPIFDGPIVTIPQGPDGPIFDGPIVTIPITPDDNPPPSDPPPADIPQQPGTTAPNGTENTPPQQPTGPTQVAPYVEITSAAIDCAGMIHVTYDTGATPELAPENEHVLMFSPASNPAAVTSQRLLGRAVNGTFTVDLQAPAVEAYRVFVVADFEPADLDGVAPVDEADAPAPTDCPTAG